MAYKLLVLALVALASLSQADAGHFRSLKGGQFVEAPLVQAQAQAPVQAPVKQVYEAPAKGVVGGQQHHYDAPVKSSGPVKGSYQAPLAQSQHFEAAAAPAASQQVYDGQSFKGQSFVRGQAVQAQQHFETAPVKQVYEAQSFKGQSVKTPAVQTQQRFEAPVKAAGQVHQAYDSQSFKGQSLSRGPAVVQSQQHLDEFKVAGQQVYAAPAKGQSFKGSAQRAYEAPVKGGVKGQQSFETVAVAAPQQQVYEAPVKSYGEASAKGVASQQFYDAPVKSSFSLGQQAPGQFEAPAVQQVSQAQQRS